MTVLAGGLAFVAGITLGLFGGGGAVLTVPILVYIVGVPAKAAVPLSLVVVGLSSAVGALGHWRWGTLALSDGARFAVPTVIGAYAGARAGALLPDRVHLLLFAGVMTLAAGAMWRSATRAPVPREGGPRWLAPAAGVLAGTITGVVGVGGGFLFVPALVSLLQYSLARATAVSLMVIALNASAALAGYGVSEIDWGIAVPFVACTIAGLVTGSRLAPHVPAARLKQGFAVLLLLVGTFVIFQNLH